MKTNVEWLAGGKSHLSQMYESGMEYAFISEDMRQCHPFIYCKDFLQDAMWAMLHGKKSTIYGFSYSPKEKPPLFLEKTRIAIVNSSDKEFSSKISNTLDFVNQVAKKLRLLPTKVIEVSNPTRKYKSCGVWIFDGSPRWQNAPPMLSMYSLLLRAGFVHKIGQDCMKTIDDIIAGNLASYQESDGHQLGAAKESILKIIKLGYRKIFYIDSKKNYPENCNIHSMHDQSGIGSFRYNSIVPYWHRKSLQKLLKESK